ncbi:DNA cytosine methyltransferase [Psychrobacter sp. T6-1]|uniref:DNA cytosine methyltransferase n=1 Tax=Psychrobacter sp. T6-1 TaxID=3457447 RepID=UPI003FD4347B
MSNLTVIDFFCGAGGFSEGFRQMGFELVCGYDNWQPAIDTYNHNFGLSCALQDILDFSESDKKIEELPNTNIIIGSPPCVSFSSSNKSGQADKSLGVRLTETFLKIVAVKKHQKNSVLKAWFMENVINSKKYLNDSYTFDDLGLTSWAINQGIKPSSIAINLNDNAAIINSADYGAIQARKRLISGEVINKRSLIIPTKTHADSKSKSELPKYKTLRKIKDYFPNPFKEKSSEIVKDVNYNIFIPQYQVTDHFYDTGIYKVEWMASKYYKQNHPYMGKMSFPENIDNPSRTVIATKIANSRESMIYKTELEREGDGEYRLPTVREAAIIMGFPITFQFIGSESAKWRLVGNAVCCAVSRALAITVLESYRLSKLKDMVLIKTPNLEGVNNLNKYNKKEFNSPPIKKKGARFRRHPMKDGNLTVTLSNYDIESSSKTLNKWFTSIQYGTGKGFPIQKIDDNYFENIITVIKKIDKGSEFIKKVDEYLVPRVANKVIMQKMYENQSPIERYWQPEKLVDEVAKLIYQNIGSNKTYIQDDLVIFTEKKAVPVVQLFALYAINKITTLSNKD